MLVLVVFGLIIVGEAVLQHAVKQQIHSSQARSSRTAVLSAAVPLSLLCQSEASDLNDASCYMVTHQDMQPQIPKSPELNAVHNARPDHQQSKGDLTKHQLPNLAHVAVIPRFEGDQVYGHTLYWMSTNESYVCGDPKLYICTGIITHMLLSKKV